MLRRILSRPAISVVGEKDSQNTLAEPFEEISVSIAERSVEFPVTLMVLLLMLTDATTTAALVLSLVPVSAAAKKSSVALTEPAQIPAAKDASDTVYVREVEEPLVAVTAPTPRWPCSMEISRRFATEVARRFTTCLVALPNACLPACVARKMAS